MGLPRWRGSRESCALVRSQRHPEAFVEVYDEFAPILLRFFAAGAHDAQIALDLTAETLAVAYEARKQFRGESTAEAAAWLWTIARRQLFQFSRDKRVEAAALRRLGMERPGASPDEIQEIEQLLGDEEVSASLHGSLDRLPAKQRTVVHLRYLQGLDDDEIARREGISRDVVRSRSSRALRQLRADDKLRRAVQGPE